MKVDDNGYILLKNVRINFPYLFSRSVFDGVEGKYSAKFLLDKEGAVKDISALQKLIQQKIKEELKVSKVPHEKLCLRDGDQTGRSEDEGQFVLSASTNSLPRVFDRQCRCVQSADELHIKSGDYVNVKISFWAQNNRYGKRINAELIAVQFVEEGEALSSSCISEEAAAQGFDVLDADDDDFLAAI